MGVLRWVLMTRVPSGRKSHAGTQSACAPFGGQPARAVNRDGPVPHGLRAMEARGAHQKPRGARIRTRAGRGRAAASCPMTSGCAHRRRAACRRGATAASGWARCSAAAGHESTPACRPAPRAAQRCVRRRPRRVVERDEAHRVAVAHEALAQRPAVAAGRHPQAAVVDRGVFERDPEAGHASSARCAGRWRPGASAPRRRCPAA